MLRASHCQNYKYSLRKLCRQDKKLCRQDTLRESAISWDTQAVILFAFDAMVKKGCDKIGTPFHVDIVRASNLGLAIYVRVCTHPQCIDFIVHAFTCFHSSTTIFRYVHKHKH